MSVVDDGVLRPTAPRPLGGETHLGRTSRAHRVDAAARRRFDAERVLAVERVDEPLGVAQRLARVVRLAQRVYDVAVAKALGEDLQQKRRGRKRGESRWLSRSFAASQNVSGLETVEVQDLGTGSAGSRIHVV